jgi:hypothetical protein
MLLSLIGTNYLDPQRSISGTGLLTRCRRLVQDWRWQPDRALELLPIIGSTGTDGCDEESQRISRNGREELNAVAGVKTVKVDKSRMGSIDLPRA